MSPDLRPLVLSLSGLQGFETKTQTGPPVVFTNESPNY